ncbi:hypothetical protein K503DRAFT_770051 [Rhizopogon vinicolor AM-OR11-026]|uniref:Uncharacterized protein n=1 Tax=Rhizopogon vinicolor AM-OR11-026 TaxID=1314800 RepID=A0A1B7N1U2_9AGAM|nr:hypothetical protein K503DRAFT_770051 [Rhizopogon vinicolor AM-OR11-026]
MLRHGLLSPHSKLLPTSPSDPNRLSIASNFSHTSLQSQFSTFSNLSDASLVTNSSTGSKHPKDSRDTPSRRVRHRDGRLLRGGIGLTTGLGWSDSEDEDAPSPLTRRLSALNLSRRSSATSISTSHSYSSLRSPHPLSRSISHSILREEEDEDDLGVNEFGRVAWSGLSASGSKGLHVSGSRSLPLNGRMSHVGKDDTDGGVRLEEEFARDGVTPTRFALRDSDGSSSSGVAGTGNGIGSSGRRTHPHTPSSTASTSSLSLPFPATPESPNPLCSVPNPNPTPLSPIPSRATTPSLCNIDKSLPPLPLTPRKYPPSLSRMRTYSSTSSVGSGDLGSKSVVRGGGAGEDIGTGTSTPRPSFGGVPRPSLGGVPRPSLNGTSRPSIGTPRPSLSTLPVGSISLHPHPSMSNSSLSTPNPSLSSLLAQNGHGHESGHKQISSVPFVLSKSSSGPPSPMPRPLKLLQPGEQPPRPGSMLRYNRNVHDQLKRTQSQSQPPSPVAMTQTLVIPGNVGEKPKPRTGTGMVYRSSSGPAASRMRAPSAVRPSGVGVAL